MTITASPLPSGNSITLGDDSSGDLVLVSPLPSETRASQVEPLFEGASVFLAGRGNRVCRITWTVSRVHATLSASIAFANGHRANVPQDCSLAIVDGGTTTTYTQATIDEVTILELTGRSTLTRYTATVI